MYLNTAQQVVTQATASTSFTTDVAILNFGYGGFQVIWSSINGTTTTFKLQSSLDGVNFNDYTSSTITITSGSSNQVYEFIKPMQGTVVRCVYAAGNATSGKIDLWISRKGHV